MKKLQIGVLGIFCLVLIGALIAGCGGGSSRKSNGNNPTPVPTTPGGVTSSWIETFNNVPTGTDIQANQSTLDNPTDFTATNMAGPIYAGTTEGGAGSIALDNRTGATAAQGANSQRIAFTVPGLSSATTPALKLTVKNLNAAPVTLLIGDSYSATGNPGVSGQRAHGTVDIPSSSTYSVVSVSLNTSLTNTNMIQIRPTVIGSDGKTTSNGAGGIYIDKIEVTGVPSGSNGTPSPTPTTVAPTPTPTSSVDATPTPTSTVAPTPTPTTAPTATPTTAPTATPVSGPEAVPGISGWYKADIGTNGGSASYSGGTFTITSSGTGLPTSAGSTDSFTYVYAKMPSISSDFTWIARVVTNTSTNTAARVGIMVRSSTSIDSAYGCTSVVPGSSNNAKGINRAADSQTAGSSNGSPGKITEIYLRVGRTSGKYNMSYSLDGGAWTQITGTKTIAISDPFLIGFCVASGDANSPITATFDNYTTPGSPQALGFYAKKK